MYFKPTMTQSSQIFSDTFQFQQTAPSDGGARSQAPPPTPGRDPWMDGWIGIAASDLVRSDRNFPAVTRPL